MILYGTTHRVGDAISTEDIIATEQRAADDPAVLAAHCLAAIDPAIAERAREGDLLLAGHGFGAGESCDATVLAMQALGFAAVICSSCAPAFDEAAQSYGLPVLVCPAAVAAITAGGVVRLDLASGQIEDRASGARYQAPPCAPALVDAVRRSALLVRMRRVVDEEGFDG
jgi:3-isopropylmalate/(R)-2-methylmalate dehydratase small subunit